MNGAVKTVRWVIAAAILMLSGPSAAAQEWTGWRGADRDGIAPASHVPGDWPQGPARAWRAPGPRIPPPLATFLRFHRASL